MNAPHPRPSLVVLAFAIIYLVWGSTYLAIRFVVETIPPFTSAAIRFLIAGGLLLAALRFRGTDLPTAEQWRHSAVSGTLMLVGGNGLVVWAEKSIASGLAALLVALAPIWFALLDWLRPNGIRPAARTILGIVIGFAGVCLLVGARNGHSPGANTLWASLAVIVAGLCWAGGSLYSKHSPNSGSSWMNAAAQMICGGAGLAVVGIVLGEQNTARATEVSARSVLALLYLIVLGSWIGYSAYIWLLKHVSASAVSTYAYVNPVIAVFLGWLVFSEPVNSRMIAGAAVVIGGVLIINLPNLRWKGVIRAPSQRPAGRARLRDLRERG